MVNKIQTRIEVAKVTWNTPEDGNFLQSYKQVRHSNVDLKSTFWSGEKTGNQLSYWQSVAQRHLDCHKEAFY